MINNSSLVLTSHTHLFKKRSELLLYDTRTMTCAHPYGRTAAHEFTSRNAIITKLTNF